MRFGIPYGPRARPTTVLRRLRRRARWRTSRSRSPATAPSRGASSTSRTSPRAWWRPGSDGGRPRLQPRRRRRARRSARSPRPLRAPSAPCRSSTREDAPGRHSGRRGLRRARQARARLGGDDAVRRGRRALRRLGHRRQRQRQRNAARPAGRAPAAATAQTSLARREADERGTDRERRVERRGKGRDRAPPAVGRAVVVGIVEKDDVAGHERSREARRAIASGVAARPPVATPARPERRLPARAGGRARSPPGAEDAVGRPVARRAEHPVASSMTAMARSRSSAERPGSAPQQERVARARGARSRGRRPRSRRRGRGGARPARPTRKKVATTPRRASVLEHRGRALPMAVRRRR